MSHVRGEPATVGAAALAPSGLSLSERVRALGAEILASKPALCAERARLVTAYFRQTDGRRRPMVLRKAEAHAHLLRHKQVRIHPRELLVGCFTSQRVGGGLYPELHGLGMMEDLFRFERRSLNPLTVSAETRRALLREVLPYWLRRSLPMRAFRPLAAAAVSVPTCTGRTSCRAPPPPSCRDCAERGGPARCWTTVAAYDCGHTRWHAGRGR